MGHAAWSPHEYDARHGRTLERTCTLDSVRGHPPRPASIRLVAGATRRRVVAFPGGRTLGSGGRQMVARNRRYVSSISLSLLGITMVSGRCLIRSCNPSW